MCHVILLGSHTYISYLTMLFQFFRSLQGVAESVEIFYLRKVLADINSVMNITTEIEKLKSKRKLEDVFAKLTNCSSWEETKLMYPEHAERVDEFLGDLNLITFNTTPINRKFIL
ncbi:hypothetical protein CHS0354_028255 [Potamilus streckersoni]|uniref:Uncharacterized protein n=1 Tax=Potamilus streckersoni TaxID=2493646 RepID=A0AAE0RTV8_9BIVA|nr:hypothetical protein CHS0354_028255 [Potamilus streckersoni]